LGRQFLAFDDACRADFKFVRSHLGTCEQRGTGRCSEKKRGPFAPAKFWNAELRVRASGTLESVRRVLLRAQNAPGLS
jgi:hypothetical protein